MKLLLIILCFSCSNGVLKYGAYNDGSHPRETVNAINKNIDKKMIPLVILIGMFAFIAPVHVVAWVRLRKWEKSNL
jgi:hypothetical protein